MISAAKKRDIPETLFDEPNEVEDSDYEMSDEMSHLCRTVEAKLEKRKKSYKRSRSVGATTFARTTQDTQEMIDSGDWDRTSPRHLVALYSLMHIKVYGIEAVDLDSKTRYRMTMMAANLVNNHFEGNFIEAVDFFRWMWTREMRIEKWRREEKQQGGRLTAYKMFSTQLLTEYRLFLIRTRE